MASRRCRPQRVRVGADQAGPARWVMQMKAWMASASWNDHEPTSVAATSQAPRKRSGRVLRQVWWTSVPIWSFGFLSFVPFLAFAVIQRRKRDWAVFAGYLVATVAWVVALSFHVKSDPGKAAVGGFGIVLMACAAIHACILFQPVRLPLAEAAWRRNQELAQGATSRIERRTSRGTSFRRIRHWPESSASAGPTCRGSTTTTAW